jgi:hypothetical protein
MGGLDSKRSVELSSVNVTAALVSRFEGVYGVPRCIVQVVRMAIVVIVAHNSLVTQSQPLLLRLTQ